MLRILYVNGGMMDRGGISTVMMNYYLKFNPHRIHIDFLVHGNGSGARDEEIMEKGGKIFVVPPKSKNPIENYIATKKVMKDGNYDIVHAHADSGNAVILKIAKECGIQVRISHSHNTDFTINSKVRALLNNVQKAQINKYATHKWACSTEAGKWLYGEKSDFEVIPNAIDVTRFVYNPHKRNSLRKEYNLSNNTVIGHIGRFDYQKNQVFLIDLFARLVKQNDEMRLVLVGDGKDRAEIETKIQELKIEDKILLLGQRNDVNEVINMFDVFACPSRFEGLGVVVVEAQANGLKCICSEHVPTETNLTGDVIYLPLEITRWEKALSSSYQRQPDNIDKIIEGGYEINTAAKKLEERYMEMVL